MIISAIIIFVTIVELPKKFEKNDTNRSYSSYNYLEPEDMVVPEVKISEYNLGVYKISDLDVIDKVTTGL